MFKQKMVLGYWLEEIEVNREVNQVFWCTWIGSETTNSSSCWSFADLLFVVYIIFASVTRCFIFEGFTVILRKGKYFEKASELSFSILWHALYVRWGGGYHTTS